MDDLKETDVEVDDAAYAGLAKELDIADPLEQLGDEPAAKAPPAGQREPVAGEKAEKAEEEPEVEEALEDPADDGKAPQRTPEELATHNRRLNAALKEAREAQRQSQEQVRGIMEFVNNFRQTRAAPVKEEAAAPKIPSLEEDPIGHFTGTIAALQAQVAQLQQGTQQEVQQVRAETEQQRFLGHVRASEEQIRAQVPDYDDACADLETKRFEELKVMYPGDSPVVQNMARQHGLRSVEDLHVMLLNRDRIAIAQQALQLGISPAQMYYNAAKLRGYVPKGGKGKTQDDLAKGAAAAVEAVRRGKKAAKTISGGEGAKGAEDVSMSDLADMLLEDPEAADKLYEQMARKGQLG
jgi:hypothetical protein